MGKCDKLLREALNSPANLRFDELCRLAECYGFVLRKGAGTSHRIYKRPEFKRLLNVQDDHGKAKAYQVRQLLDALVELGEIEG